MHSTLFFPHTLPALSPQLQQPPVYAESNGKQERKHEAQLTILPVQHSKVCSSLSHDALQYANWQPSFLSLQSGTLSAPLDDSSQSLTEETSTPSETRRLPGGSLASSVESCECRSSTLSGMGRASTTSAL